MCEDGQKFLNNNEAALVREWMVCRYLLQETFRGFQHFIDTCSKYIFTPMDKVLRVQSALNHDYLTSLPKATMSAYTAICLLGLETVQTLGNIVVNINILPLEISCRSYSW